MLLQNYLKSLEHMSEEDKETTHRAALEHLLKDAKEEVLKANAKHIKIKHEPNNDKSGLGAPDFMVLNKGLVLGYVENKRVNTDLEKIIERVKTSLKELKDKVNTDLEKLKDSEQITKYLQLSPNIIITDYLHFILIRKDEKDAIHILKELRICDFKELKRYANLNKQDGLFNELEKKQKELIDLFTLFYTHEPKPINTALEFASALALRTRILKDSLIDFNQNKYLCNIYKTFKNELLKELSFNEFCDSFAQALTYSLFLARLNNAENKELSIDNVRSFIPRSFPLIRAMSRFLDYLDDLDSIRWLLNEILYITSHINTESIIKELNKYGEKYSKPKQENLFGEITVDYTHKDPYLHFYETFLSQYDPKLRKIRGVYYTPASIVRFIINAIDSILKDDFKFKKGLGESLENKDITLLDFATGTGTFLLEAFYKTLEYFNENSINYEPKELLNQFFGFEVLVAPYIIAHLKLYYFFEKEFESPLSNELDETGKVKERLGIYLTNTLYMRKIKHKIEENKEVTNDSSTELEDEFKAAQTTKQKQILIITGNPPYSGESANKGLYEDNVRISYGLEPGELKDLENIKKHIEYYLTFKDLPHTRDEKEFKKCKNVFLEKLAKNKLKNEKNPKGLLDDYVKFICFAESKIKEQGQGIFAFISNNSFLDNPTFRGMRYHLLSTFDKMYILDLHGSTRKKEVAKDGSKDENVFDIMQGVSINIFIKTQKDSKNLARLYHYELFGKRNDKYNFLNDNEIKSIPWQELKPQKPFYLFIPQNYSLKAQYDKGWSVKDMFKISSVGIVGGRDKLVISNSESQESLIEFKNRIKRFMQLDIESARKEFNLGEDSRDWKIKYAKQELEQTGNDPKNYVKIAYRPFDFRWTYYTGKSKGFHCTPRGEVMQHFLQDFDNVGLVYKRGFLNSQNGLAFSSDKIIDFRSWSCSGMQGGDYISPLYIQTHKTQKGKKTTQDKNLFDEDKVKQWQENFTESFRKFINQKYAFTEKDYKKYPNFFKSKTELSLAPEAILGYIYAVLFHKDYREKYLDFLKIDFPKVPFVSQKEKFLKLSELGQKLIQVHLLGGGGMNLGLVCPRQLSSQNFTHSFIVQTLMEMCYISNKTKEVNYLFPLYIKV